MNCIFIPAPARVVPHADSLFPQGGEVLDLVAVTLAITRVQRPEPPRTVFDSQLSASGPGARVRRTP